MKQFTLKLANASLEKEYFESRYSEMFRTFKLMQILSILQLVIVSIYSLMNGLHISIYFSFGWQAFSGISYLIVKKWNTRYITVSLCINAFIIGFAQYWVANSTLTPSDIYLVCCTITFIQNEFTISHNIIEMIATMLVLLFQKLLISYFTSGLVLGQVSVMMFSMLPISRSFIIERFRRNNFLIQQRQKEWDRELDNTFTNNFISCYFDSEKFKFISKKINKEAQWHLGIASQGAFITFLRQMRTEKFGLHMSLESYLFSLMENFDKDQVLSEQIYGYITNQIDSCYKINISVKYHQEYNFILIIEDDKIQNQLKKVKKQCTELRCVYKYLMFTSLKLLQQNKPCSAVKRTQITNKILNINMEYKQKIGMKLRHFRLDRLFTSLLTYLNKPNQVLVIHKNVPIVVKQDPKLIVHCLINLMDLTRELTFLHVEVNKESNTIRFRMTNVVKRNLQKKLSDEQVTYYKLNRKLDIVKKILKQIGPSDEIIIQRQSKFYGHVTIQFDIYKDMFTVREQLRQNKEYP